LLLAIVFSLGDVVLRRQVIYVTLTCERYLAEVVGLLVVIRAVVGGKKKLSRSNHMMSLDHGYFRPSWSLPTHHNPYDTLLPIGLDRRGRFCIYTRYSILTTAPSRLP